MGIHRILAPALVVAAAHACGGALEPAAVRGTWYLHAYNDSTVPGRAVFRSGRTETVFEIDSVRLVLGPDSECDWLVHLRDEAASVAATCVWNLNAGPDDLMVTIDGGFVLRGEVLPASLALWDPNDNLLRFEREPAVESPVLPDTAAPHRSRPAVRAGGEWTGPAVGAPTTVVTRLPRHRYHEVDTCMEPACPAPVPWCSAS